MDADSEKKKVKRTAVEGVFRLEFEVPWPPYHVAAYLIEGDEPVLIDAGGPSDDGEDVLSERLGCVGYEPDDVSDVIVTHPHSDHIGKVPELRDAGAEVHAPRAALEQVRRTEDELEEGVRTVGRQVGYEGERLNSAVEKAVSSLERNRRLLEPDAEGTHELAYDEFVVGGRSFDAYRTPGHQIHHASFVTEIGGEKVIFSGDAVIETFRPAALHTGIDYGAFEAVDAFYDAMETFDGLDVDHVLPGHGPVFTELGSAVDSTRDSLNELLGETVSAVDTVEPASPVEVTEERCGEIKYPGQLLDVIGALGTLEGSGEVEYEVEEGVRKYTAV
ncbi:MAG: MBL fold metallo-hydrolase [Halobacteriales archaeon]|nr:MBL fold metallo-hydrolase [Halobacteriales archaeon]